MIQAISIQKGEFEVLNTDFISVLRGKQPANRRPVLIKGLAENEVQVDFEPRISKVIKGENPMIYVVIYEPDVVDSQHDFAKAAVIKTSAHRFLEKGLVSQIDENHNFSPGAGKLVESHILNSTDDDHYPGVRKGAWVGAIKPNETLIPYLDEITGVSLAGTGIYKEALGQEIVTTAKARAPLQDFRKARAVTQ